MPISLAGVRPQTNPKWQGEDAPNLRPHRHRSIGPNGPALDGEWNPPCAAMPPAIPRVICPLGHPQIPQNRTLVRSSLAPTHDVKIAHRRAGSSPLVPAHGSKFLIKRFVLPNYLRDFKMLRHSR